MKMLKLLLLLVSLQGGLQASRAVGFGSSEQSIASSTISLQEIVGNRILSKPIELVIDISSKKALGACINNEYYLAYNFILTDDFCPFLSSDLGFVKMKEEIKAWFVDASFLKTSDSLPLVADMIKTEPCFRFVQSSSDVYILCCVCANGFATPVMNMDVEITKNHVLACKLHGGLLLPIPFENSTDFTDPLLVRASIIAQVNSQLYTHFHDQCCLMAKKYGVLWTAIFDKPFVSWASLVAGGFKDHMDFIQSQQCADYPLLVRQECIDFIILWHSMVYNSIWQDLQSAVRLPVCTLKCQPASKLILPAINLHLNATATDFTTPLGQPTVGHECTGVDQIDTSSSLELGTCQSDDVAKDVVAIESAVTHFPEQIVLPGGRILQISALASVDRAHDVLSKSVSESVRKEFFKLRTKYLRMYTKVCSEKKIQQEKEFEKQQKAIFNECHQKALQLYAKEKKEDQKILKQEATAAGFAVLMKHSKKIAQFVATMNLRVLQDSQWYTKQMLQEIEDISYSCMLFKEYKDKYSHPIYINSVYGTHLNSSNVCGAVQENSPEQLLGLLDFQSYNQFKDRHNIFAIWLSYFGDSLQTSDWFISKDQRIVDKMPSHMRVLGSFLSRNIEMRGKIDMHVAEFLESFLQRYVMCLIALDPKKSKEQLLLDAIIKIAQAICLSDTTRDVDTYPHWSAYILNQFACSLVQSVKAYDQGDEVKEIVDFSSVQEKIDNWLVGSIPDETDNLVLRTCLDQVVVHMYKKIQLGNVQDDFVEAKLLLYEQSIATSEHEKSLAVTYIQEYIHNIGNMLQKLYMFSSRSKSSVQLSYVQYWLQVAYVESLLCFDQDVRWFVNKEYTHLLKQYTRAIEVCIDQMNAYEDMNRLLKPVEGYNLNVRFASLKKLYNKLVRWKHKTDEQNLCISALEKFLSACNLILPEEKVFQVGGSDIAEKTHVILNKIGKKKNRRK